ncbi:ABC transporter substrate-binding protein [Chitinimonas sp. BJYL2]|uniref:ABC transporter substrate-binding protein n=1 Tax=Chitinimonas sp. BJYL2 TaxID=2976696 RepID=UPI0022B55368|nr:ABC transporter substrate-binding protein [Chitinimonas sp. BJYL2]
MNIDSWFSRLLGYPRLFLTLVMAVVLTGSVLTWSLPRTGGDDNITVLRFAWWGGAARHQATLKAIALFEERNPGVKVKAEYMGFTGYLERTTTQIAGRAEPDLMQINWAWMAMFSKRGTGFANLDDYAHLIKLKQFDPADVDMGRVNGKLNALTASYTARVMLWNESAYKRLGLPLPKTWDELFATGEAFRKLKGENAYPLDGELYDMILLSQAYVHQKYGTPYIDPAQPRVAMSEAAALEWVRTYKRLIGEHVATPLPLRASLGGAEKPTEQQPDWVVGNWAGNYTWDSLIGLRESTLDKDQKLVLGDFPTLPGAVTSGMFGRPTIMYAVSRHSKHPEMAVRLMDFLLTDPEAGRIMGKTRGIPAVASQRAVLEADKVLPELELRANAQIRAQRQAGRVPMPSPLFEHARMQKFMREVFETVAYGKASDEEAAKRLVDDGNALLHRIK